MFLFVDTRSICCSLTLFAVLPDGCIFISVKVAGKETSCTPCIFSPKWTHPTSSRHSISQNLTPHVISEVGGNIQLVGGNIHIKYISMVGENIS